MRRLLTPLLIGCAALLLVACGDGAESSASRQSAQRPATAGESSATTPGSAALPGSRKGSESGGTGGGPVCDAAARIRSLDDTATTIMSDATRLAMGDPQEATEALTEAIGELEPLLPELTTAYDDLAATVPERLVDDVELVKSFTLSVMESLADIEGPGDFGSFEESLDPNIASAASAATLEIDAFTREQCGISIAG